MANDEPELAAIQAGDADAFGAWMARNELALRIALRPLARHVDTEAVVQESLLRVWQIAPKFQPDGRPHALLRFAITIAKNLARSELRIRKPDVLEDETLERALADELLSGDALPDPWLREWIHACHQKLPSKPKEALTARLADAGAQNDSALAERLGMTLNTFLQNFTRARKLLSECLRKKGVQLAEVLG